MPMPFEERFAVRGTTEHPPGLLGKIRRNWQWIMLAIFVVCVVSWASVVYRIELVRFIKWFLNTATPPTPDDL